MELIADSLSDESTDGLLNSLPVVVWNSTSRYLRAFRVSRSKTSSGFGSTTVAVAVSTLKDSVSARLAVPALSSKLPGAMFTV